MLIPVTSIHEGLDHAAVTWTAASGGHELSKKEDVWGRQCLDINGLVYHHVYTVQNRSVAALHDMSTFLSAPLGLKTQGETPLDVTVILRLFMREHTLFRQVRLFLDQSPPPKRIWLLASGTPKMATMAREVIRVFQSKLNATKLEIADLDPNLKLYSAWQLALQVETKYLAVYDDDQMPGSTHLAKMLQAVKRTGGVVGVTGRHLETIVDWRYRVPEYGATRSWIEHCSMEHAALRVDKLDRHWVLESKWIQYLWREELPTYGGGDDFWLLPPNNNPA